jgi:hypothetical protein
LKILSYLPEESDNEDGKYAEVNIRGREGEGKSEE